MEQTPSVNGWLAATAHAIIAAAPHRRFTQRTWIMQRPPYTKTERLLLALILLAGAWLRVQNLGAIEYNIDQAYPIWQALRTLDAGHWPLTGQGTSVLFDNPPLTGYLYLPVVALTRQPLAVYVFTIALNTLTIWLAWRALARLLNTRAALVATALLATNPWIIEDSRRTWVQALAPFFVALVFWALTPVLTGQTRHPARRLLIALGGLTLFAHTYLLAYALLAPVGLLIALYWQRVPKRALLIGAACFIVFAAFYAAGLLRNWDRTSARAESFAAGQARLSDEALGHALRLVTGDGYADVRGMAAPAGDAQTRQALSHAVHVVWVALIAVGAGRLLLTWRSGCQVNPRPGMPGPVPLPRDRALILLTWFALPVLMMSYVSRSVHPFYLLLTLPAGHGLAAWGVRPALNRRAGVALVAAWVTCTGALNGLNTVRFAQASAAHPGEDLPGTLPLAEATALGTRLREALAPEMAILAPMPEWTPPTLAGKAVRTEEMSGFERAVIVPPRGALLLTVARPPEVLPPPLYATPAASPLVFSDGSAVSLWRATPEQLTIAHPADIPSDILVSFVGWTLKGTLAAGETATLDLFWRVDGLSPDRGIWTFAPYAHLLDGNGARVAVVDGAVISALDWVPGDLLVYRLPISIPPDAQGPFALQVGLFDSVRARPDGTIGVNAIFRLDDETFVADLPLIAP
jgi:4-amino-4-deoxy-L-arabinose transferase-like glycosyltransferase